MPILRGSETKGLDLGNTSSWTVFTNWIVYSTISFYFIFKIWTFSILSFIMSATQVTSKTETRLTLETVTEATQDVRLTSWFGQAAMPFKCYGGQTARMNYGDRTKGPEIESWSHVRCRLKGLNVLRNIQKRRRIVNQQLIFPRLLVKLNI